MRPLITAIVSALTGFASLARAGGDGDEAKKPLCPTVTTTAEVCSTCPLKKCLAYETVTLRSDCPSPVPTSATSYPCRRHKCPKGCASTSYVVVTPTQPPSPCPTITSTRHICSTCIRPMCITETTISCRKGCPVPVPTVYTDFRCGGKCPGGCATQSVLDAGCKPSPT